MVPATTIDIKRQLTFLHRAGARDRTAIFLHIGKTAGTTLNSVLDREFPSAAIFTVDSHEDASARAQLTRLRAQELARLRLVRGHLMYGVHEVLPQRALYFSLLRDPCERLISAYGHIRSVPSHRLHRQVVDGGLSFEEFVTSGVTIETDNWQLRCLAGDADTRFGECDERMLDRAIENVRRDFAFLGIAERFDESLIALSRMYGWRNISYVRLNQGRSPRPTITPRIRAAIEPQLALDRELYVQATEMLTSVSAALPALRAGRHLLQWVNVGQRGVIGAKRVLRRSRPGLIFHARDS